MAFNFSEKMETGASTLIVDALNLAFRWKHQGRTDFRYEYKKTIESLAKSYDCSRILIAADWGSSSFRKSSPLLPVKPPYKNPKYFNLTRLQFSGISPIHSTPLSFIFDLGSRPLVTAWLMSAVLFSFNNSIFFCELEMRRSIWEVLSSRKATMDCCSLSGGV